MNDIFLQMFIIDLSILGIILEAFTYPELSNLVGNCPTWRACVKGGSG
jgi:hypothetical protein